MFFFFHGKKSEKLPSFNYTIKSANGVKVNKSKISVPCVCHLSFSVKFSLKTELYLYDKSAFLPFCTRVVAKYYCQDFLSN